MWSSIIPSLIVQANARASVPIPAFAHPCGSLECELRNQRDTSNAMILVPLLNPKFRKRACGTVCANFGFAALVRNTAAWIVALGLAPSAHQCLEFGIAVLGQDDADGSQQIADPAFCGKALPLEAKGPPGTGAGRNRKLDRALKRGHSDLAAQHRLVKRDRKLDPQIGSFALKQRMGRDRHRDQKIAGAVAETRLPLALEADLLPVR